MTQYKYYFISDTSKEAVGKIKANTRQKAIEKAAGKKKLSIEHFLELFNVEEV